MSLNVPISTEHLIIGLYGSGFQSSSVGIRILKITSMEMHVQLNSLRSAMVNLWNITHTAGWLAIDMSTVYWGHHHYFLHPGEWAFHKMNKKENNKIERKDKTRIWGQQNVWRWDLSHSWHSVYIYVWLSRWLSKYLKHQSRMLDQRFPFLLLHVSPGYENFLSPSLRLNC